MKTPLFFLAVCCLLLSSIMVNAQESGTDNLAKPFFTKSVGVHAGTQGLGVQAQMPIFSFLNLRAGASIMPFKAGLSQTVGSKATNTDMSTSFFNTHLLTDWHLFPKSESVFNKIIFTAGAGYFFNADGKAETALTDPYYYGDIYFTPGELGVVTTTANWEGIAPYAGFGLNNIRIDDKVNFSLGLGAYYLTSPSVSVVGTRMLSGNSVNQPTIQNNLKDYRFLPVLQFNVNYSFKSRN